MKIKRTINDIEMELELTQKELCSAYYQQERNFDKEDAYQRLSEMIWKSKEDDEVWVGQNKFTVKEIKAVMEDEEALDFIAELARERMSGYDPYLEALWECVEDGIKEYFTEEYVNRTKTVE
jgi:hypothetical protein